MAAAAVKSIYRAPRPSTDSKRSTSDDDSSDSDEDDSVVKDVQFISTIFGAAATDTPSYGVPVMNTGKTATGDALAIAQATIFSLQQSNAAKDETIRKLQNQLQDMATILKRTSDTLKSTILSQKKTALNADNKASTNNDVLDGKHFTGSSSKVLNKGLGSGSVATTAKSVKFTDNLPKTRKGKKKSPDSENDSGSDEDP